MRKGISGVGVSTNTLKGPENRRQTGEESQQPGVVGITFDWIRPIRCIQTEEQFNVLINVSNFGLTASVFWNLPPWHKFESNTYLPRKSHGTRPDRFQQATVATITVSAHFMEFI